MASAIDFSQLYNKIDLFLYLFLIFEGRERDTHKKRWITRTVLPLWSGVFQSQEKVKRDKIASDQKMSRPSNTTKAEKKKKIVENYKLTR